WLWHRAHSVRVMSAARHDERGNGVWDRQEHDREDNQGRGCAPSRYTTPRKQLLEGDQRGDERHPRDAHHAQREQGSHERPAAADAPGGVPSPHRERPWVAVTPCAEQEPNGTAALPQTYVLQRCELI